LRPCAFAREKEYYSRKAAKASGRQELQKLNARDLSGAAEKSGPQFLCVLPAVGRLCAFAIDKEYKSTQIPGTLF
jgi:hypothetical protein